MYLISKLDVCRLSSVGITRRQSKFSRSYPILSYAMNAVFEMDKCRTCMLHRHPRGDSSVYSGLSDISQTVNTALFSPPRGSKKSYYE